MDFIVQKQTSALNNTTFLKGQLVNIKTLDLRHYAKMLAAEGSTASESDIMAVLTLIGNRTPAIMALGYKIELPGFGTICPTISGSLTESDWRTARIKALMAADSTLTEATAKTAQDKEEFTTARLTKSDLTVSYKLKKDTEFEQQIQNDVELDRKTTGTIDEDSTEAKSNTQTDTNEPVHDEV